MRQYERSVQDLIRMRHSWRSYSGEPLGVDIRERIGARISRMEPPPFASRLRLTFIDTGTKGKKAVKGTFGVVRGATHFLTGSVSKGDLAFEDFGYAFESLILFATSLGLGTCRMGGTLNRTLFGKSMDIGNAAESGIDGTWQIVDPGLSSLPPDTCYHVSWIPKS